LFGAPTLAVFDLASSERYAYSRVMNGATLTFRAGDPGFVIDAQTGSVWSLREGRAVSGQFLGRALSESAYPVEEIFPYHGVAAETNLFLSVWQRFDTNWYLKIAQRGYLDAASAVYFPLYPVLIRVVSTLVGNAMLAALLISNLALVGALAMLYRLSDALFGAPSARRTVAYSLLFPTAFFLQAAYTESLFLFFMLAAFDFARRDKWIVAALFGALAALTRLQGVLLIVPLAWMWWVQGRGAGKQGSKGESRITYHASRFSPLLLIPVATFAFLAFTNLSLLSSYVGELHARFVFPWDNLAASIALWASGRAGFVDVMNLLTTIVFGAMMMAIWRALPREYGLYALVMYFAPLFRMTTTQPLVSMDRYALAIFPVFILWGARGQNVWINRAIVYLSFPLQLYLSAQFVLWGWVG
ncbi:MAG: glycosyltransferase family 39 protein, partial [Anaerolineales bacterium]|nr:glycosyltransferase family 39 protein [Anaerolineales bacterium]